VKDEQNTVVRNSPAGGKHGKEAKRGRYGHKNVREYASAEPQQIARLAMVKRVTANGVKKQGCNRQGQEPQMAGQMVGIQEKKLFDHH
jgi:hypothetical protein